MNALDLQQIDGLLQKRLKENNNALLRDFATKEDIKRIREAIKDSAIKVTEDISNVVTRLFNETDKLKADKTQTLSHEVRINDLERKVFPQN